MRDLFGTGEVRVLRLETATGLLALAVVVLAVMLLWQRLSGLPVCYGTAAVAPGLIVPNEVPDAYVKALSEQVALLLYNTRRRRRKRRTTGWRNCSILSCWACSGYAWNTNAS